MKTRAVNKNKPAPILLTAEEEVELKDMERRIKNLRKEQGDLKREQQKLKRENRDLRKELGEITGGVV